MNTLVLNHTGAYVQRDIVNPIIAAAVAGVPIALIAPPGWGKTSIAFEAAHAITDAVTFVPLAPGTPPSEVRGKLSAAALLAGEDKLMVTGTAFDPNTKIVILDELFRANTAVLDLLLGLLEPYGQMAVDHGHKAIIATSNWVGAGDRLAALRDRFGLVSFVDPELPDTLGLLQGAFGDYSGTEVDVPSWDDIVGIRQTKPGDLALLAIDELLRAVAAEAVAHNAQTTGRKKTEIDMSAFNPRRYGQWAEILFRHGLWISEDHNFSMVPQETKNILCHCFPAVSPEEAAAWVRIVLGVGNSADSAVRSILTAAFSYFKDASQKYHDDAKNNVNGANYTTAAANKLDEFTVQVHDAVGEGEVFDNARAYLATLLQAVMTKTPLTIMAEKTMNDIFGG